MVHRRVHWFFVAWMLCLLAVGPGVAGAADDQKININTAGVQELTALRGVGEVTAKAIVAYREQHGAFKSIDDLVAVKGIGPKTLASFRDRLTVGDGPGPQAKPKPAS